MEVRSCKAWSCGKDFGSYDGRSNLFNFCCVRYNRKHEREIRCETVPIGSQSPMGKSHRERMVREALEVTGSFYC